MTNTFNLNDCRDLKNLMVEKTQPLDTRLKQYIKEVKDPCKVRVGDIIVQIEFAGKKSFTDALSAAFLI